MAEHHDQIKVTEEYLISMANDPGHMKGISDDSYHTGNDLQPWTGEAASKQLKPGNNGSILPSAGTVKANFTTAITSLKSEVDGIGQHSRQIQLELLQSKDVLTGVEADAELTAQQLRQVIGNNSAGGGGAGTTVASPGSSTQEKQQERPGTQDTRKEKPGTQKSGTTTQ